MEIKIGIQHVGREVTIETSETAAEVESKLRVALSDGGLLVLRDTNGRCFMAPADRIGYVDIKHEHSRPVGFGSV